MSDVMGKLLRLVKEQADAEWPEEAFSVREEPAHQVPSYSNGVVLSPETYNYRTRKPEKKGLYSEEVFGAVEGSGEFMDDDRAELWGHIELSAEVPHPRGGEPLREIAVMPPTYRRFRRECEEESQERARLERDRVMNGASECEDLPSQVLGEAGLWNHDEDRPLTDEEIGGLSGSIVEPQVGGHYRRVVNLSRRLRRLREMMAPEMVLSSNEKSLGRAVHALFFHVEAMELPGEVRDRACGAER